MPGLWRVCREMKIQVLLQQGEKLLIKPEEV
jgi:hypothetical protein